MLNKQLQQMMVAVTPHTPWLRCECVWCACNVYSLTVVVVCVRWPIGWLWQKTVGVHLPGRLA